MAVNIDTTVKYNTILFRFLPHPNAEYSWFSDMLQARYNRKLKISRYKKFFTDTQLTTLRKESYDELEKHLYEEILAKSADTDDKSAGGVALKEFMTQAPMMYMVRSGKFNTIDDQDDLGAAYNTGAAMSTTMKEFSQDGTFLVIYKSTALMFPESNFVNGKDWTMIKDAPTPPPPPVTLTAASGIGATQLATAQNASVKAMADSMAVIAKAHLVRN